MYLVRSFMKSLRTNAQQRKKLKLLLYFQLAFMKAITYPSLPLLLKNFVMGELLIHFFNPVQQLVCEEGGGCLLVPYGIYKTNLVPIKKLLRKCEIPL